MLHRSHLYVYPKDGRGGRRGGVRGLERYLSFVCVCVCVHFLVSGCDYIAFPLLDINFLILLDFSALT